MLKDLNHPNVLEFFWITSKEDLSKVCIVTELCDGTLNDLVKARRWLSLGEVSRLSRQIMEALDYLHSNNVIHR